MDSTAKTSPEGEEGGLTTLVACLAIKMSLTVKSAKAGSRAIETEVPAAARTVAISACAKERKHCTTAGSNCVPLDSTSLRTASSYGKPFRYGRDDTMAWNASITDTIRETTGISVSFNPAR